MSEIAIRCPRCQAEASFESGFLHLNGAEVKQARKILRSLALKTTAVIQLFVIRKFSPGNISQIARITRKLELLEESVGVRSAAI